MYTIEVEYTTGNSFNSERCTEVIGLAWESKELARKALKTIQEQYKLYRGVDECYNRRSKVRTHEEILKDVESKDWNINDPSRIKYKNLEVNFCSALMDDGTWRSIGVDMWCGYFEQLHNARVVLVNGSDDDFIEFD